MGRFNRNALDFRQGFERTYNASTKSGLAMHEEIERRLRSGPHAERANFLLGTNKASPETIQKVMAKLGIEKI